MSSQVCVLKDGTRVRFSLKRRGRDPFYLATFRGPDGRRKEKSTGEPNKRRAADSAIALIKKTYEPESIFANPSWDEAVEVMVEQMRATNLRQTTIQDYEITIRVLQRLFADTHGPAEITPAIAEQFKIKRQKEGRSVHTVRGNLNSLNVVYNRWWIRVCKLLRQNPFSGVLPPKSDKSTPRIIDEPEMQQFLDWMSKRWDRWRLPLLFLEVKRAIGCRILELAAVESKKLKEGRIIFESETTKGRKTRNVRLPDRLFRELRQIAGKKYIFEAFVDEHRRLHLRRGRRQYADKVMEYTPKRLVRWLERQATLYFRTRPDAKRFKLHNFRGTAMSRAKGLGISYEDAAVAFGCNPETMRKHYVALDELAITDSVMDRLHGSNGKSRDGSTAERQGEHEEGNGEI